MTLPRGYTVELDRHTRVTDGGRVLIGGSPTRVLHLTAAARRMLRARSLTVTDRGSGILAERLLDVGMADPVLHSLPAAERPDVTFVVPVRDRPRQLARLLASLGAGGRVIVVDDASRTPGEVAEVAHAHGATLVALATNVGPAGARNAGLARVRSSLVAFVDSDVVVPAGTVETLARHFADPRVAVVAPRVTGLAEGRPNWIGRYENARSSLDLGEFSASVRPRSRLTWVSSTFLLARVDAIGAGFAAEMRVGEDVDLVWRMADAGHRVRYEPAATVAHDHRTTLARWLARKAYYGTSANPLAQRHPHYIAPAVLAPWGAVLLGAMIAQRRWSIPVVAGTLAVATLRVSRKLERTEHPVANAARLTASGTAAATVQGAALLLRHWWPLTLVAGIASKRVRRAALAAALLDTAIEYARRRPALDPVRFAVLRRLDDLAYGAGVWSSALRARSVAALKPMVGGGD